MTATSAESHRSSQGEPTVRMTVNVQLGFGDLLSANDIPDCDHSIHDSLP
jgi:hypothetical protein